MMDSKRNKSSEIIRLHSKVQREPILTCVLPPLVAPRLSVLCSRENYLVIMDMPSCADVAAEIKESLLELLDLFSVLPPCFFLLSQHPSAKGKEKVGKCIGVRGRRGTYLSALPEAHASRWLVLHAMLVSLSPDRAKTALGFVGLPCRVSAYTPCIRSLNV